MPDSPASTCRDRVFFLLFLAFVVSFGLACGSGGSGSGGDAAAPLGSEASGRVILPTGMPEPLTSYAIANPIGDSAIAADGSFTAQTDGDGPSFVALMDEQDRPVLFGWVDPDDTAASEISATSTATVLLFTALEGWLLQNAQSAALIALIQDHPATAELALVIETELVADPGLFAGDSLPIAEDVRVAVASIGGAMIDSGAGGVSPATSIQNTNILATPQTPQSGILVGPNTGGPGLQVTNQRRRNLWYFVYKVASEDADGLRTEIDPPTLVREGFLGGTSGLTGTVQTITDWATGNLSFADTSLENPIELAVADDESAAFYEVAVAGGFLYSGKPDPSFFDASIPRHLEWQERSRQMLNVTLAKDVLFPLIFSFVGPLNSFGNLDELGAEGFEDIVALGGEILKAVPAVGPQLANGEFFDASIAILRALPNSPELRTEIASALTDFALEVGISTGASAARFLERANIAVIIVDTGLAGLDILWVGEDMAISETMSRWTVEATPVTLLLSAERDVLTTQAPDTTIAARVPMFPANEQFCWQWTLNGVGELSAFSGESAIGDGAVLVTDTPQIQYLVSPMMIEPGALGIIDVEAFQTEPNCGMPPNGESAGTGTIAFTGEPSDFTIELLPRDTRLRILTDLSLSADVMGAEPTANLEFEFSTNGTFGDLQGESASGNFLVQQSNSVIYRAGPDAGDESVFVDVYQIFPSERVLLGSSSAAIRIRDGETECANGISDDDDSFVDCLDRDCADDDACRLEFRSVSLSLTYPSESGDRYFVGRGYAVTIPTEVNSGRFQGFCANYEREIGGETDYAYFFGFREDCSDGRATCYGISPNEYFLPVGEASSRVDSCLEPGGETRYCNEAEAAAYLDDTIGETSIRELIVGTSAACSQQSNP